MDAHCRSQCGCDGHSLRSCHEPTEKVSAVDGTGGSGEIMLFGVRVKLDHMRKSVSLNNLSQYEGPNDNTRNSESAKISADEGYASADDAVLNQPSSGGRERKRGIPWTEEEHKLFLLGLQKVGKGDWRGISRNFVKTRTPTQVASHAQKYFLRRSNLNRRRRRSSLFDITTDSVAPISAEELKAPTENSNPAIPFAVASTPGQITYRLQPIQVEEKPMQNLTMARTDEVSDPSPMFTLPVPILSLNNSSTPVGLNLNESIESEPSSLSLSLSLPLGQSHSSSSRHLGMPSFSNEDTFITVA